MSIADRFESSSPAGFLGNGHVPAGHAGRVQGITRNEAGQIVVRLEGRDEPVVDARIARCFPWSLPETYVSIRTKEGKELVLLKTLNELDEASRSLVRHELQDKVFNPRITRIAEHKTEFGVTSITAETDRGRVIFQVRTRDDVRVLSPTRLLFRDADGNTYEVADSSVLDFASRRFLQDYF
jgi:hypothetical protein